MLGAAISRFTTGKRVSLARSSNLLLPTPSILRAPPFRTGGKTVICGATAQSGASTVKIIIQGRKLPVTEAIRDYVEDKVSKAVAKFQNKIRKIDVTLSARGGDTGTLGKREQKVEVTISTHHFGVVRVEDKEDSLYASIDVVCDKVKRKLQKVKESAITTRRRGGSRVDDADEDLKEYMEDMKVETLGWDEKEQRRMEREAVVHAHPILGSQDVPDTLVRAKVVLLEPMGVEAAIDAMEQVGHDFYVFREGDSDTVQVVYKRKSGGYGILVPRIRKKIIYHFDLDAYCYPPGIIEVTGFEDFVPSMTFIISDWIDFAIDP